MVIGDMGATSCSAKLPFGIHSILYERKPHQITVDTDRTCCDTNRCVIPMRVTPIYYDGIAPPWIASSSSISTCTTTTKSSQQQQHINTSSSTLPSSASHHAKKHDQSQSRHDMTRRIGHPYQSRAPAKHKKPRTSFSKKQIALLESRFLSQKYLASTERASLASELHMSDAQVKTWFQNRRTKWRRQEAEEKEFEDKANARMLSYTQCFFARPDITL